MPKRQSKQRRHPSRPTRPSKPAPRRSSPKAALMRIPAPLTLSERIEQVVMTGDLSGLDAAERLQYVKARCHELGISWLAQPFAYIVLNGKMILYALRSCTDQLRRVNGVSVFEQTQGEDNGLWVVQVKVRDRAGRTDTGTGAWSIEGLKGEARVNAILKAETKAKRRATLSICGLGMLDESELDTLDDYGTLTPGGRVMTIEKPEPSKEDKLAAYDRRETQELLRMSETDREGFIEAQPKVEQVKIRARLAEAKGSQDTQPAERPGAVPLKGGAAPAPIDITPHLHYELTPSDSYFIDGTESLKKANRDMLAPLYVHPTGIMATAAQLGKLISEFERRKVPFRDKTPLRQPGE